MTPNWPRIHTAAMRVKNAATKQIDPTAAPYQYRSKSLPPHRWQERSRPPQNTASHGNLARQIGQRFISSVHNLRWRTRQSAGMCPEMNQVQLFEDRVPTSGLKLRGGRPPQRPDRRQMGNLGKLNRNPLDMYPQRI